jgi:hypothetical protein
VERSRNLAMLISCNIVIRIGVASMLIKSADSKELQITILQNLLVHDRVSAEKKQQIDRELRSLSIGIATERKAAFEIDFYFTPSKNVFVIHDLRLEVGGRVAQIDHLLMNRAFEVYVLETKTFSTGLSINERGEFSTFYDGREIGIPSPIEQNERHISVLKEAFKAIGLPKRFGLTIQPSFHSVVLVSPKAVINRPKISPSNASVIKLDQFFSWYKEKSNTLTLQDVAGIFKVCSSGTVMSWGRKLLALHKPGRVDYIAKFDLGAMLLGKNTTMLLPPGRETSDDLTPISIKGRTQYFCANCKSHITAVVAKFCWNDKARFGGKAYCRACQSSR